jgi:hypothetical protein
MDELARTGQLSGALSVPGAINPLRVTADLKSNRAECSVTIESPKQPRALTRVKWLTNQLNRPPPDLLVQATEAWSRAAGTKRRFANVKGDPASLVERQKADIRSFTLTLNRPVGTKRTVGRGSFIESVLKLVDEFYEGVVQDLKPDVQKAPQVPRESQGRKERQGETELDLELARSSEELGPTEPAPISETVGVL